MNTDPRRPDQPNGTRSAEPTPRVSDRDAGGGIHDAAPIRNPDEARQGRETGRVRWVLAIGTLIAAIVLIVAFLFVRPG